MARPSCACRRAFVGLAWRRWVASVKSLVFKTLFVVLCGEPIGISPNWQRARTYSLTFIRLIVTDRAGTDGICLSALVLPSNNHLSDGSCRLRKRQRLSSSSLFKETCETGAWMRRACWWTLPRLGHMRLRMLRGICLIDRIRVG